MSYVKQPSPALLEVIASQDGVASVAQLASHGLDRAAVYRRIKSGRWQRLLPTVILTNSGHPSRRQLLVAATLFCGAGSAVDGADACVWYGVPPPDHDPRYVQIVVPRESGARTQHFVVVRRACAQITVGDRGLVPYVDAATALIVAARRCRTTASAMGILSRGLQMQLVDVPALPDARRAIGDKFCRGVDQALLAVGVGLRSPAEKTNHDLIATSRVLPQPRWNQWVDLGDGGAPVCADALWEDAAMFEEVLGKRWHAWGQQFEMTEARRSRIVAAGMVYQGATPSQLRRDGAAVLRRLEQTYVRHVGSGLPAGVRLIDPPQRQWRAGDA